MHDRRFAGLAITMALLGTLATGAPASAQGNPAQGIQRRLYLLGGAPRPRDMWVQVSKLVPTEGKGLVLPWASGDPEGSMAVVKRETAGLLPPTFWEMAPPAPLDEAAKRRVVEMIADADAIFLLGGDQNRFLDVANDPDIRAAIKARYEAGIPIEANDGTAIAVGDLAVTGDDDPTVVDGNTVGVRPGLGLLPGMIIDTQFIKRQRSYRMLGLLIKNPDKMVLGIDSGTAFVVVDNCAGEVLAAEGRPSAIAVAMRTLQAARPDRPGHVDFYFFRPGHHFTCEGILGESR